MNIHKQTQFIFFLFVLLQALNGSAQIKGKIFNQYFSPKEYHGSTQNWAITSDNSGIMYFGNHEGVLEYDGNSWRKIEIPNKSTVRSLAKNKKGNILVGAVGELGYLSPNTIGSLKFVSLKKYIDTLHSDFADVWSVQSTNDGDYFLTDNYLFRYKNKKIKIWQKHGAYFYLCFNINNELYLYEVGIGLQKIIGDSIYLLSQGDFFKDKKIHALLPFENKLLVFTRNDGLFVYNPFDIDNPISSYSNYNENSKQINDFLIKNTVYSGVSIIKNVYAITTLKSGGIVFNLNGDIIDIINNETTGTSSQIYTLFYGKDGNLWLGLDNGIQKIELSSPFRYWDKTCGISGSVNNISSLKNNLYFATGTGLYKLNLKYNIENVDITKISLLKGISEQVLSFLLFNPSEGNKKELPFNSPKDLFGRLYIKDTTLLVGTSRGLYAVINDKAELLTDFKGTTFIYQSTINPSIIYLGMDNGISYLSYSKGKWFFHGYIGKIVDQIKSICEDEKGNLWIAANYKGIYNIFFDSTSVFNNLITERKPIKIDFYDNSYGIPNMADILIYKVNQKIKFYTKDVFYIFNKKNKHFALDPTVGKNYADYNWKDEILSDPENNIWINTNNRFYNKKENKYYSDTLTFRRLYNYLIGSVHKENNQKLWLGASDGIFIYQDYYQKEYFLNYKTVIRSIYLNGDSLIFNGTNFIKNKYDSIPENILRSDESKINLNTVLTSNINSIAFNYSALFFDNESKTLYSHILLGYDNQWSPWNGETKKEYTNLKEGKYIFKVKSKNIFGIESTVAEFEFKVLPPWYRTIWAYLLFIIIGIGVIVIIVKLYTIRLRNEKQKLENIVLERTQEILNQKEEIQAQSENLKEANERILKKNKELEFQKEEITKQAIKLQEINIDLIKLSKVASETDNAIIIFDKEGNIEWVNNGFTRMYGYTLEQFKKEKHINIIDSSENPNINETIKKCIEEKKSIVYELKTKTREGKVLWLQTTLTHIVDENLNTINLIAIETDITKLKLAEEEITTQKKKIEKQRDLLEISNATITKFFRIIAHDLRNPISTLVTSTGIVLHDIKYYNKEKTTKFISELNKLSQTTYILLENLLDWSSSQMGEIAFSPKTIEIDIIVNENIDLIYTKAQSKGIMIYVDIPKYTKVYADENMIKAVVRNILSNAIKFTPENGTIAVFSTNESKYIRLNIKDNGIGMSETDLKKLFRADVHHTTLGTSNEKGSGLGLILCKEFIEKNGGTLNVISKVNEGTTFSFTLKKA